MADVKAGRNYGKGVQSGVSRFGSPDEKREMRHSKTVRLGNGTA